MKKQQQQHHYQQHQQHQQQQKQQQNKERKKNPQKATPKRNRKFCELLLFRNIKRARWSALFLGYFVFLKEELLIKIQEND